MIQIVLLFCYTLLSPVTAFPRNVQKGSLDSQPSFTETDHPPNMLSDQIRLPDPKTCQYLLHTAPSLAPLPEYISRLALELALEEVGCSTEAHTLRLQLIRMGEKDTAETLIREIKKHSKEEGDGNTKVMPKDLGISIKEFRRVQRSVTLPEACQSDRGMVLYETAKLMIEFVDKLPSSELLTEFKNSAINVTQQCTEESWVSLQEQCERLIESPEIQNVSLPLEDQMYFLERSVTILVRIITTALKGKFLCFWFLPSPAYPVPDMCSLRHIVISVELLLCCLLLLPVDTISYGNQTNVLIHLPSSLGSWPTSSDPLSCQSLLPKSLSGFPHMAPLHKFLVGLPLLIALKETGCEDEARALQQQLYHQGGVKATQILTQHLQELQKGKSTRRGVSADALASALQLVAREQAGPERARRSLSINNCEQEQEQSVYNIVRMVPGVGTYYNLGTALYYASQNCTDKAKERGQDGVLDLGYDFLMSMAGVSGGPMGLWISAALKPAVKVGVQRLIQYYSEKETNTPGPETSQEGLGGTSHVEVMWKK
ncbi:Apolipoprotein F [Galemys pyrenaicus]|uniref:Apolipoprotein F n=1 Tax=Galemys pyrenaicus TaxID=202257 RepID=A0A8J5ZZ05_GALPY|nr:Apolipoprotein F [Galemys pyrenaicus]